jgi:hypothetical protein
MAVMEYKLILMVIIIIGVVEEVVLVMAPQLEMEDSAEEVVDRLTLVILLEVVVEVL